MNWVLYDNYFTKLSYADNLDKNDDCGNSNKKENIPIFEITTLKALPSGESELSSDPTQL